MALRNPNRSEPLGNGDLTNDRREAEAGPVPDDVITPAMDRRNGRIVILSALLHYLAAPVIYVGIVQGVAGSLWAQYVLGGGIASLLFPRDFAILYLTGIPCMVAIAILNSRYQLVPVKEEQHPPLFPYLWRSIQSYRSVRILVLVWLAYLFWYLTINAMPNLTLYAREAVGKEPQELSGWMMALRFGFKCLGGLLLGIISVRWGIRAPLFACVGMVGAAILWAWLVPGHLYLLAFGIMGAGELGGVYFPNYVISISSASAATRNLAIHSLVSPVSSIGPALHGGLTDLYGFPASFTFGLTASIVALILVLGLSSKPSREVN